MVSKATALWLITNTFATRRNTNCNRKTFLLVIIKINNDLNTSGILAFVRILINR